MIQDTDYLEKLKQMKIWVCFIIRDVNGKIDKTPISAYGTETGPDITHAHTWVTYYEAIEAMNEYNYGAVGFSVPDTMGFMDIDHMDETDPFVQTQLDRFNSYTERSYSGKGLHIYFYMDPDKIPTYEEKGRKRLNKAYYQKNPNNGIEMYFGAVTNRFSIFTGNVIRNVPMRNCTDAALQTLNEDMRRKSFLIPEHINYETSDNESDDFDVICQLRNQKNGKKFCRLYDDGDYSDYRSQSEADCALCAMIAFRTGPDFKAIDRLFRSSALYRSKWERNDYRESTIQKGIEACQGKYHYSTNPTPDFICFDEKKKSLCVSVPKLAQHVRDNLHYLMVRDSGRQSLQIYVYENGVYKPYDDNMFKGCIKQFIEEYDPVMVKIPQVNEVYQHIITDRNYISQRELNSKEDIINFKNGLLVVSANELKLIPHTPDIYSTIQIPSCWTNTEKPTPNFDMYINTLCSKDKDVIRLILQFMGACISNVKGWRMKKSLFLVGPGDTGKSLLKSLVESLLGTNNFIGIDLKEIESRFGTGVIYGTHLAGSSDMSFLSVDELKAFKKLTGGDSVFAEFKGQQGFEFTYDGLLWFCMNKLPRFGGDNGKWVYNRIMVVKCPNEIPPEKQDKKLLNKMYGERDGIIYRAVKALQQVICNGYNFDEPQSVISAREQYMSENNTVVSFFEECMCLWKDGRIQKEHTTGLIYKAYKCWCRDNNNGYAKSAKEFREDISTYLNVPYEDLTTRMQGNTYFKHYGLNMEILENYDFLLHKE